MPLLLLTFFLTTPDRSVVGRLPVLATLAEPGQTRVILRGDLTGARAREMAQLARAVQRDVTRRLLGSSDKSHLPPVDLCLFASSPSFHAFERALTGFTEEGDDLGVYYPALRVVL